jgi:hypothetical protein
MQITSLAFLCFVATRPERVKQKRSHIILLAENAMASVEKMRPLTRKRHRPLSPKNEKRRPIKRPAQMKEDSLSSPDR